MDETEADADYMWNFLCLMVSVELNSFNPLMELSGLWDQEVSMNWCTDLE